jgi:hypothetical protein
MSLFDDEAPATIPPVSEVLKPPRFAGWRPRSCVVGEHVWKATLTLWPGETFERRTWTCQNPGCSEIRGRAE